MSEEAPFGKGDRVRVQMENIPPYEALVLNCKPVRDKGSKRWAVDLAQLIDGTCPDVIDYGVTYLTHMVYDEDLTLVN